MRRTKLFIIFCTLFAQTTFAAIIPTSLDNGTEGLAYKEVTFTSNKTNPKDSSIRWKVLQAPPGITIDEKNGKYSGKPTQAGNYTLSVLVYQIIGGRLDLKDSTTIKHTINATTPPTINSPFTLPNGQYDQRYQQLAGGYQLTAKGDYPFPANSSFPSGFSWEVINGGSEFKNLPQGLTLSKGGLISGVPTSRAPIPTSNQTYTFRVKATDLVGKFATANLTLVINKALPPQILSECPMPDGLEITAYKNFQFKGLSGKQPYFWAIQPATAFPPGLKLDYQTGVVTGIPSSYGNYTFSIVLSDTNGFIVNKNCSITIHPVPHITTTEIFDCATVGKEVFSVIEAIGGTPPYTWDVTPPMSGVTITPSALKAKISGNFTTSGSKTVTVKVTDPKTKKFTTKSFSFLVHPALEITTVNPLETGNVGETYADLFTAKGGKPPYTWQILPQIYVSDFYNQRIRKFTENGSVTTYAGNGVAASINGNLTTSSFSYPYGLGFDPNGNIYVADSVSSKIRKISSSGNVTTLAPSFLTGTNVGFATPEDMVVDSIGNTYVSCTNTNDVKKIDPSGIVSVLASASAGINHPQGICWDLDGNILLANMGTHQILKITTLGSVSLVGGSGAAGSLNGNAAAATFNGIHDLKVDFEGNVYVDDYSNKMIRKISMDGSVSTLANLSFNPFCLSVDSQGYVYVTNAGENKIMKVSPQGIVTHIAGSGKTTPIQNGPVLSATFNSPHSVDINPYEDLPFGLTLNATTGLITGKTKHNGLYNLTYRVTDSCGNTAISNCTLTIDSNKPEFDFELPWKFTDQGATAVGHNGSLRNYTSNTLPSGALWSVDGDNLTLKVSWENSSNCLGGTNSNTQSATATINMTTTKLQKVGLSWIGIGELEEPGFEKMEVYIDGNLIGSAEAAGGNKGCEMGPVKSINNYPTGYTLPVGNHVISINATTNDRFFHTGAYYQFTFTSVE